MMAKAIKYCAPLACLALLSAPAMSAVVTVLPNAPVTGTAVDLSLDDFQRTGLCGGGGSVVNDGCSVIAKADPSAPDAFGRFDPLGHSWVDSQDIDELDWTFGQDNAFTSMTFALTDAHDQKDSHFVMSYFDGTEWASIWDIASMQTNANLYWLRIDFAAPVTAAALHFSTKVGNGYDGYGISALSVEVAPVPVPQAALLLLTGAGALAGLKGRRKRRSA